MQYKLIVENIRLPYYESEDSALKEAKKTIKAASIFGDISNLFIHKKSIDARHKDNICFVYSVYATASSNKVVDQTKIAKFGIKLFISENRELLVGDKEIKNRIVVVGFGPAGMFASLLLSQYGYKPLVLEMGAAIDDRIKKVERFLNGGELDFSTNIQFGAGGAGTFSDGKLTTRISDYRCERVLDELVRLGAPEDIKYKAKPHIGSDILRSVVSNASNEVERLGGEIRYNTKVDEIYDDFLIANGEKIYFDALVLAIGHSSRNLYKFLISSGYSIEAKPFSVGVRIEHIQKDIDFAMYGNLAGKYGLEHADYQLSYRRGDRGTYSFCMCPGGTVIAASSEEGGVVTNGMSNRQRDNINANSAIAVSVNPSDFNNTPLNAIEFQRNLENRAFNMAGKTYSAPCQLLGDYMDGKIKNLPKRIIPSYRNGDVKICDLNTLFPAFVNDMLKSGFIEFGKKIKGFNAADVPITGVESRTSAPIRILRDEKLQALGHLCIYPCGEGAGYAGGIMSAAVDGIKVAEQIISIFKA